MFRGGGIDTQRLLPFGSPDDLRDGVRRNIDGLGDNGGNVFNTIHNVQAKTPIQTIVAMIETVGEYR